MRRPKVRDRAACPQEEKIRFTSAILPKWTRRSKSLDALLPMLHLRGISTGDFQEALAAIPGQDRFLPFFGNLFHFLGSVRPSVGSGLAWEDSFPSWRSPAGLLQGGNPSPAAASSSDATTLLASGERPTAFEKSKHSSKRKAHSNHDPQAAGIQITGPLPQESPRGSEAGFRDHHGIFRGKRCVAKTVFPSQKFRFLLELFIPLYQADRRWTDEFF